MRNIIVHLRNSGSKYYCDNVDDYLTVAVAQWLGQLSQICTQKR